MEIIEVETISEYNKIVKSCEPWKTLIVDAYAPWCGPCKKLSPILDSVLQDYKTVQLIKINTDEVSDIIDIFKIQSLPSVFGLVNGKVVASFTGLKDKTYVTNFINKIIADKLE